MPVVSQLQKRFTTNSERDGRWVHKHTNWKTFKHCCTAMSSFMPDLIDCGFDIINPVQLSAAGMDARTLKDEFGKEITFWGGGTDTQHTLPFGTPEEVPYRLQFLMPGDIKRAAVCVHTPCTEYALFKNVQIGSVHTRHRYTLQGIWDRETRKEKYF